MNISLSELKNFYNINNDFKQFVDKCIATYNWSLDMALLSPTTIEYYKYLLSA